MIVLDWFALLFPLQKAAILMLLSPLYFIGFGFVLICLDFELSKSSKDSGTIKHLFKIGFVGNALLLLMVTFFCVPYVLFKLPYTLSCVIAFALTFIFLFIIPTLIDNVRYK